MSINNSNEENNANILRKEDIVPPYNDDVPQKHHLQKAKANRKKDILSEHELNEFWREDDASSLAEENVENVEETQAEPDDVIRRVGEIPKFDLAEQIMAEQRKITSIRRKAPGQRAKTSDSRAEPADYFVKQPPVVLSQQQQIIADIVARDIEKFCRENNSNLRMHDF